MTTATVLQFRGTGVVPADSFPVRLAIVRASMGGWNYRQASKATGIGAETWRLWEKRERTCQDMQGVSRKINKATGISFEWLMIGGELAREGGPDDGVRREGLEPPTRCFLAKRAHRVRRLKRPQIVPNFGAIAA